MGAKRHRSLVFNLITLASTLFLLTWFLNILGQKDLQYNHLRIQLDSLVIANNELHQELHIKGINDFDYHKLTYTLKPAITEENKYIQKRITGLEISLYVILFLFIFVFLFLITPLSPSNKKQEFFHKWFMKKNS